MKFKVGDKVKIKPYGWFEQNCTRDSQGDLYYINHGICLMDSMKCMCNAVVTISEYWAGQYLIKEHGFPWADWMFEETIKTIDESGMETVLIPFDINKAKAGAKIVTQNGHTVRVLCYDFKQNNTPIVAAIKDINGEEYLELYSEIGIGRRQYEHLRIEELRPKVIEMTKQEIADKLGINVDQLIIK